MSNFTPLVAKTYTFEGDEVKVEFSRLKRKHMLSVTPHLSKIDDVKTAQDAKPEQLEAINELLNDIIDVIPEYVSSFTGLKDNNGLEIRIQSVVDDFYFLRLAIEIALDMIRASSPVREGNA